MELEVLLGLYIKQGLVNHQEHLVKEVLLETMVLAEVLDIMVEEADYGTIVVVEVVHTLAILDITNLYTVIIVENQMELTLKL